MQGTITIDGYVIRYVATVKRIKNINLHVYSDRVEVNIPRGVSQVNVESCLARKIAFIKRMQTRLNAELKRAPIYSVGSSLCLGGQTYIVAIDGGARKTIVEGGVITFACPYDCKAIQAEFLPILKEVAEQNVKVAMKAIFAEFSAYHIEYPTIVYKKLLSVWGMCNNGIKRLTFNIALGLVPYECVEYVVVHELAHFVEPNHSAAFHSVVARVLPQWKERRKLLKDYSLREYFGKY